MRRRKREKDKRERFILKLYRHLDGHQHTGTDVSPNVLISRNSWAALLSGSKTKIFSLCFSTQQRSSSRRRFKNTDETSSNLEQNRDAKIDEPFSLTLLEKPFDSLLTIESSHPTPPLSIYICIIPNNNHGKCLKNLFAASKSVFNDST